MLAAAVQFTLGWDGWIHLVQDGHDLPRGPLGVLLYIPFALIYPAMPRATRRGYLIGTSLLLALATLGVGYTATILGLCGLTLTTVQLFGVRSRRSAGVVVLSAAYTALVLVPQPPWLAPLAHPLYFYLHWAGIGYIFLKSLHVLVDVGGGHLPRPSPRALLAYLLFAPTLRMGPIYRFTEFDLQLEDDPRRLRDRGAGVIRIVAGLVRLGAMAALLAQCPIQTLFEAPGTLSPAHLLATLYAAPLSIYLWISGYVDLSVGVGLFMGFRVPENFCYPWKATSLAEFWRRWHLTLGAWLRDYIYIPLGGSRQHVFFNYFVTFLFCGVWHGLYASYALWGMSQGVGLGVGRLWSAYWKRHREDGTPLYRHLARLRLVNSMPNTGASWLLTFHYQILTIAWFMDEKYAGARMAAHLVDLLG